MPGDIPTPADVSTTNFQLFDAFWSLEQGDRVTFGGGIDDHEVVFCHPDCNGLFLWVRPIADTPYPDTTAELGECLLLFPAYTVHGDGSQPFEPAHDITKHTPDDDTPPNTIGTLTDATVRTPDDRDHRVCEIEWNADFSGPEPDQPDQEPFDDPDAVIDDRIGYEDHYFEYVREPYAGPPAPNQFYLKATNYGAAHVVPFGCRDSICRIDISTTIGEVRDFIKEHMDPELRKAYEQTGKAPKHLLAAEEWTRD
jgi:hypothetical protein